MARHEYVPILPTASASESPASRRPLPLAVAWAAVAATALLAVGGVFSPSSPLSPVVDPDADAVSMSKWREPAYPPGPDGSRDLLPFCEERFIRQPLDHFKGDFDASETFDMRYFVCAPENFDPAGKGAIFFYVGNEADVTLYLNHTGLMWENARDFGALLVFAEHRYFGKSVPFGLDVLDHLEFLSTQQALADYAVLIEQLKDEVHADVPVIGFGGSYGGMLGTWFRLKYPHIIDGVIAGSAPVLAFLGDREGDLNSEGFNRVITYDMSEAAGSAPNCIANTRRAIAAARALSNSSEGRQQLAEVFRLCDSDAPQTPEDVQGLIDGALGAFGNLAMGNYPYPSSYIMEGLSDLPAFPVRAACEFLAPDFAEDDLAGLVAGLRDAAGVYYNSTKDQECFFPSADNTESDAELTEDEKKAAEIAAKGNLWGYLECSELYMPFSSDGVHDIFPAQAANLTQDNANCLAEWGVHLKPRWAQTEFGGVKALRLASNIVFSNGDFDPWSATGVRESLSDSVVAVRVPEGAHHLDLMFSHPLDTRGVRRARETELWHIQKWIDEFYADKKRREKAAERKHKKRHGEEEGEYDDDAQ